MVAQLMAPFRTTWVRNLALLVAVAPLLLAGCSSVGTSTLTFWDVIWGMIVFYFIFLLIWIFIAIFADILRRHDISGGLKAIWIIAIVILPFLGALVYIISRQSSLKNEPLPGGVSAAPASAPAAAAAPATSTADEIAKLQALRASGAITEAEYQTLKAKALA
jgi:hypothetical protein